MHMLEGKVAVIYGGWFDRLGGGQSLLRQRVVMAPNWAGRRPDSVEACGRSTT